MRHFSIILCTALLILFCSFNSNENLYSPIDLANAVLVKPVIFKTDKLFAEIYEIRIIDSVLVLNSNDGKGCLQLFDKSNFKFLKTKGIIGKGPEEFPVPRIRIKTIKDSLYVLGLTNNTVSIYNKDAFINDSLSIAERKIKFEKYKGTFDMFPFGKFFVSKHTNAISATRFALNNSSGKHLNDFAGYPHLDDNINQGAYDIVFRDLSIVEPKPDHTKFVALTILGGILEFFNIKDGSINKIAEKKYLEPKVQNKTIFTEETILGFSGVSVTDRLIYASYSGLSFKVYNESNQLFDYVAVFDWNGNLKKFYKVEGGLFTLAVDEAQNRIYIVTKNSEGEYMVGYF